MESYIKVNGKTNLDKAMVDKSGQMVQFIKECGVMVWLMVKADLFIPEVMYTKEIG